MRVVLHKTSTEDRVKSLVKKLEVLRLRPIDRPTFSDGSPMEAALPPDLTIITDEELGELYTQFCAMAQWVGFQYAVAQRTRAQLEILAKRVRSRSYLSQHGNREEKAARSDIDPVVVSSEDELQVAADIEGLTYPVLNAYLIGKEATSREITRRQGVDWGRGNMGNSSIPRVPSTSGGWQRR
jgi:hypothetical protein